MFAAGAMADHARLQMLRQQLDAERIQGGAHGGDLIEHIDAVALFFDHSLNAIDLADDPPDSCFNFG
jgi:hypothetical protein